MKTMTKMLKRTLAAWLLSLTASLLMPASASAQFVLGGWQSTSDDGWVRVDGSGNGLGSILSSANDPSAFELVTNVVAGYPQSLDIKETGYGNIRAQINITSLAGGLAAWTNNSKLNFTFSCGPDTGAGAGYMQLVQFQYNSDTSGFHNISGSWAANGFSETGSTNSNSGGQPIYYFSAGSTPRSQVVTWDYSSIQASVSNNPAYLQVTFVFQTGGGAPTNIYLNNVTLSGNPASVPAGAYVIDDFSPAGVNPANPTNYDNYASAQVYSQGQITNVWINWFGTAFLSDGWDSTSDAQNNSASGSLKISAIFPDAGIGGQYGPQFLVMDNYSGINPPLNGFTITNFECDIRFDPSSTTEVDAGVTNFGTVEFGTRGNTYNQYDFGSTSVPATQTNWVHVQVPVNASLNLNISNIPNVYIKMYSGTRVGPTTLWVDNVKLSGPVTVVPVTPPTLTIQPAKPGLRFFVGSTANVYDREELATVDSSQSWISPGSYPVKYSFTLLSFPANVYQTHIFLVPVNTAGQANMGNAGSPNEFIEYQASNTLWMILGPTTNGIVASVQWKTNTPNANPNITALTITNQTAVGTWTLEFDSASTGKLTAPGASPVNFTITDPNVLTDFANPLVAYFGIQPNSTAGYGQYEDWASISVTGVAGTQEVENFTTDSSFNPNGYWANNSAQASSLQLVTSNTPYWISWPSVAAIGYGLGTAMSVTGNTNTSGYPWVLPEYYNSYNDGLTVPGQSVQGTNTWLPMPTTCLPTTDGTMGGPLAPNAYFKLFKPSLQN